MHCCSSLMSETGLTFGGMKGLGVLGVVLCSTLVNGLAMEKLSDEAGLVQEKVTARGDWKPTAAKITVFWMAIFFDVMWISLKLMLAFTHLQIGPWCEMQAAAYWYTMTVLVIGWVFKSNPTINYKDLSDGVDMASQQLTSIGYGSTTADKQIPEMAVYHALNGVASQLGPANALFDILPAGDDPFKKALLLVLAGAASWLLFNVAGFEGIDPLYATMITATTIGYGDLAPSNPITRFVSALVTPALVSAYNSFWDASDGDLSVGYKTLTWCGGVDEDEEEEDQVYEEVEFFANKLHNEFEQTKKETAIGEEVLARMFGKRKTAKSHDESSEEKVNRKFDESSEKLTDALKMATRSSDVYWQKVMRDAKSYAEVVSDQKKLAEKQKDWFLSDFIKKWVDQYENTNKAYSKVERPECKWCLKTNKRCFITRVVLELYRNQTTEKTEKEKYKEFSQNLTREEKALEDERKKAREALDEAEVKKTDLEKEDPEKIDPQLEKIISDQKNTLAELETKKAMRITWRKKLLKNLEDLRVSEGSALNTTKYNFSRFGFTECRQAAIALCSQQCLSKK